MQPITVDLNYWTERRNERITVSEPEKLIEMMQDLLYQPDIRGIQITIEKTWQHEGGT